MTLGMVLEWFAYGCLFLLLGAVALAWIETAAVDEDEEDDL